VQNIIPNFPDGIGFVQSRLIITCFAPPLTSAIRAIRVCKAKGENVTRRNCGLAELALIAAVLIALIASNVRAQNLFVSKYTTGSIYEFTPQGVQTTFVSGLAGPEGLVFDATGDLFVADAVTDDIYEFSQNGSQTTFATDVAEPRGMAVNAGGDLFVAVTNSILEFMPGGSRSTFATGLDDPEGLAFNSAGNLFESDYGSGNIYEFTPLGAQSTFASGLDKPLEVVVNSAGDVFEGNFGNGDIYEFTPLGTRTTFASGLGDNSIYLAFQPVPEPSGLALLGIGAISLLVRRRRRKSAA